jgi:hypothetical protein
MSYTVEFTNNLSVADVNKAIRKVGLTVLNGPRANNPLAFLYKGNVEYGDIIEDLIFGKPQVINFNDNANPFTKYTKNDQALYKTEWEKKTIPLTIEDTKIKKVVRNQASYEQFISEQLATLVVSEEHYVYQKLKGLLPLLKTGLEIHKNADSSDKITLTFDDFATITASTTIDELIEAIKNTVDEFVFVNNNYMGYTLDEDNEKVYRFEDNAVKLDNIRIMMPYKLINKIDVVKLADVFNLSKVDMMAKIIKLDNDDDTIYIVDSENIGYYSRQRDLKTQENNASDYTNHFYKIDNQYFINPFSKFTYADCSAML